MPGETSSSMGAREARMRQVTRKLDRRHTPVHFPPRLVAHSAQRLCARRLLRAEARRGSASEAAISRASTAVASGVARGLASVGDSGAAVRRRSDYAAALARLAFEGFRAVAIGGAAQPALLRART
eukprot:1835429-Prymnesium_polylepis.2